MTETPSPAPAFDAQMKVFTCIDHESRWVGGASVVVAHDEEEARTLLVAALEPWGLHEGDGFTLQEMKTDEAAARVLRTGEY